MDAMLVIRTSNGFAVMPFTGDNLVVEQMAVATRIKPSYTIDDSVTDILQKYFHPEEQS